MVTVSVAVLGRIVVEDHEVRGRLERRLVAGLVVHRHLHVSRDLLIDIVWGDQPPRGAAASLQSRLSRLRDLAGPEIVTWNGSHYEISIDEPTLDCAMFESLVNAAPHLADEEALRCLDAALMLWKGRPFAELDDEEFVQGEAARLLSLRENAQVARLTRLLRLGQAAEALAESEALVREHPFWEEMYVHRAHALALAGRVGDALRGLRAYRTQLASSARTQPGPEILACEADLARGLRPVVARVVPSREPLGHPDPVEVGHTWRGSVRETPSMVGRDRELRDATMRLDVALRGAPQLMLLDGLAGIGKSRFLESVGDDASRRVGARVVSSVCAGSGAVPFAAIDDLLYQLGIEAPGPRRRRVDDDRNSVDAADETRIVFDHGRAAAARVAVIVSAARRKPLVVLLGDVHRADAGTSLTVQLLAAAMTEASSRRDLPLFVGLARNSDEPASGEGRTEWLDHEPVAFHATLGDLDIAELSALIESCTSVRPSSELVHGFVEQLGGHPLAVLSALRSLRSSTSLRISNGQLCLERGIDIAPHAIGGSSHRLAGIDDNDDGAVLTALALLRPGVTPHDASLLIGVEYGLLLDILGRADDAGVASLRNGVVRFQHPSYRALLRERLTPTERQRVHLDITERMGQPVTDSELLSMAWHYRQGNVGASGRARTVYLDAAERYFAACDWLEASRYFQLALAGAPSSSATHARAGLAAFRAHDHLSALASFDTAVELARRAHDSHHLAHALIARERARLTSAGEWKPATRDLAEAADGADIAPADEAALCGLLAEVAYADGVGDEGPHWVERARRAARRTDDDQRMAEVEFAAALVSLGALDLSRALDAFKRSEALAGASNPWVRSWSRGRIAMVEMMAGRWRRAASAVDAALELAEPTAAWADLSMARCVEATLLVIANRHDDAGPVAAHAELVWRRSNYPFAAPMLYPLLVDLALHRNDVAGALATLDRWEATGLPGHSLWRLGVEAQCGDGDGLRRMLARRPIRIPEPGALTINNAVVAVIGARVANALDDRGLADRSLRALEALAERGVVVLPGCTTSLDAVMAMVTMVAAVG